MPINWQDGSAGGTPLSAANLNRLAVVADIGTAGTPTGDAVKAAAATQVNDANVATQVTSGNATRAALKAALAALGGTSAMPGLRAIPVLHPNPPAVAVGPGGEGTAINGSVLLAPDEPNAITFFGGKVKRGPNYPNYLGVEADLTYAGTTSSSPWAAEFVLDTADATGRFEIAQKGNGQAIRVLVKSPTTGAWQYVTAGATFQPGSDGNWYNHLVTLGAAGVYTIRLEFASGVIFFGLRVGPTDAVSGTAAVGRRVLVVGDSFTEPTVVDSGISFQWDGWAQLMSYVTGYDIWSAGSGGTGYLSPGANGAGRQKFGDRLAADVIPYAPDEVWWFGGINDASYAASAVVAAAQACWAQIKTALPNCKQVVAAPFYPQGVNGLPSSMINLNDGLQAAAATAGLTYLPIFLSSPATTVNTTLTAAAGAFSGQVRISGAWPAQVPSYVQVGGGTVNAEVRRVTNVSDNGDGTTTLNVGTNWNNAHAIGEAARRVGATLITGTGKQGSPVGDGDADRFTGSDGTHPTKAGHRNIANRVWAALRAAP